MCALVHNSKETFFCFRAIAGCFGSNFEKCEEICCVFFYRRADQICFFWRWQSAPLDLFEMFSSWLLVLILLQRHSETSLFNARLSLRISWITRHRITTTITCSCVLISVNACSDLGLWCDCIFPSNWSSALIYKWFRHEKIGKSTAGNLICVHTLILARQEIKNTNARVTTFVIIENFTVTGEDAFSNLKFKCGSLESF